MSTRRAITWATALAILIALPSHGQGYRVTHYMVQPYASLPKALPLAGPSDIFTAHGITWNIFYEDVINDTNIGFDATGSTGSDRRARVRDCATYIASVINEVGELDVLVGQSFQDPEFPGAGGFLAQGGTGFDCSVDFTNGYGFHRLKMGTKAAPGEEDVFIQFNFNFTWHAGAGNAPPGTVDLQTVLLHEITHGIGLMGIADQNGDSRLQPCTPPATGYTEWDGLLVRGNTGQPLFGGSPVSFLGNVADLTSDDVFFTGTFSTLGYNQGPSPKVYAPSPYKVGSSLAHFATGQIVGGPIVMQHAIGQGVTRREYHPLEIGALRDIGYGNAADPPEPGCDGIPGSGLEFDNCGECGGEGLSCFELVGSSGFYEEGASLTFSVAGPESNLQWRLNGVDIPGEEGTELQLSPLTLGQSGSYTVAYTTGSKAVVISNAVWIEVLPLGFLPGPGALLLVPALALAAAFVLARRSNP